MNPGRADHAREAHFAPFVRLTLSTLAVAVAGMFALASTRSAAAFAEPHSYLGRFVNREYFADYSPASHRTHEIISLTIDSADATGSTDVRRIEAGGFTELRPEVVDAAHTDAAGSDPRSRRERDALAPNVTSSLQQEPDTQRGQMPQADTPNESDLDPGAAGAEDSGGPDSPPAATSTGLASTAGIDGEDLGPQHEPTPRPLPRQPGTAAPDRDSAATATPLPERRTDGNPGPEDVPTAEPTPERRARPTREATATPDAEPSRPAASGLPTTTADSGGNSDPGTPNGSAAPTTQPTSLLGRVPTVAPDAPLVDPSPVPLIPTAIPTLTGNREPGDATHPTAVPTEKPKTQGPSATATPSGGSSGGGSLLNRTP